LALERQDIEKRDFPIGRRGYDPDAVDRHLRAIAQAVAELRDQAAASASRSDDSLAGTASEQVRAIVDAAETSASGITREAADEADRMRADAAEQAREHVAKVSEATAVMIQRVDAMEDELGALVESLRTGANRLNADLAVLQGNMGELRAAVTGGGEAAVVEEALEEEAVKEEALKEEAVIAAVPDPDPELAPEPARAPEPVEEKEPTVQEPAASGDSEGARLIALNMALNGTPREETDRYLTENFDLADRGALLDEVYARVG
jgi:DivIVA domain-containing protein